MEKEVVKIIKDLFKPIDESLEFLQRIDKKLDLQASSKLRGQLEMLELLTISEKKEKESYEICLGNLYELIEYYKGLTDQTIKEYGDIYDHRIKSLPESWVKFGRKMLQKEVLCCARIMDYASLWCLSEAAAIICLVKLKYSSKIIEEREHRLASAFATVLKFIISQGVEMLQLADDSHVCGIGMPENVKKLASLSDRIKASFYAYIAGGNALHSLIKGYSHFLDIESLIPDPSNVPELNDPSYSLSHRGIANKSFDRDREKCWRDFIGASKQR